MAALFSDEMLEVPFKGVAMQGERKGFILGTAEKEVTVKINKK